jgi:hypothetical protein
MRRASASSTASSATRPCSVSVEALRDAVDEIVVRHRRRGLERRRRLAQRRVEQRIEVLGQLRAHVTELVRADRAEERGEDAAQVALALFADIGTVRHAAQELAEVEALRPAGRPARHTHAAARAATRPDPRPHRS